MVIIYNSYHVPKLKQPSLSVSTIIQNLSRSTPLRDANGNTSIPAMRVFSEAIRYLKDHLLTTCKQRVEVLEKDIRWIITVPAIWDDNAKQFMREAAVEVSTYMFTRTFICNLLWQVTVTT